MTTRMFFIIYISIDSPFRDLVSFIYRNMIYFHPIFRSPKHENKSNYYKPSVFSRTFHTLIDTKVATLYGIYGWLVLIITMKLYD